MNILLLMQLLRFGIYSHLKSCRWWYVLMLCWLHWFLICGWTCVVEDFVGSESFNIIMLFRGVPRWKSKSMDGQDVTSVVKKILKYIVSRYLIWPQTKWWTLSSLILVFIVFCMVDLIDWLYYYYKSIILNFTFIVD